MTLPFIPQGADSACFLYALCNAKRYFGIHTPEPGDEEWENLVDLAGCRHGSTINYYAPAKALGLTLDRVVENVDPPTILTVFNPCMGMAMHACLLLPSDGGRWYMVNYRTDGPLEEHVDGREIEWPGPPNQRHWNVRVDYRAFKRDLYVEGEGGDFIERLPITKATRLDLPSKRMLNLEQLPSGEWRLVWSTGFRETLEGVGALRIDRGED